MSADTGIEKSILWTPGGEGWAIDNEKSQLYQDTVAALSLFFTTPDPVFGGHVRLKAYDPRFGIQAAMRDTNLANKEATSQANRDVEGDKRVKVYHTAAIFLPNFTEISRSALFDDELTASWYIRRRRDFIRIVFVVMPGYLPENTLSELARFCQEEQKSSQGGNASLVTSSEDWTKYVHQYRFGTTGREKP